MVWMAVSLCRASSNEPAAADVNWSAERIGIVARWKTSGLVKTLSGISGRVFYSCSTKPCLSKWRTRMRDGSYRANIAPDAWVSNAVDTNEDGQMSRMVTAALVSLLALPVAAVDSGDALIAQS